MANPIQDDPRLVTQRIDEFYQRLSNRMKLGKQNLLRHLLRLGVKERLRLAQEVSLRATTKEYIRRKNGEIEKVGFAFERHGIFLARGVGKGRPIGTDQAKKAAKDWLTPELDLLLDEIADLIADGYADIVVAELRINVPGLFTKTIPSK
jgi:hypothetical protein